MNLRTFRRQVRGFSLIELMIALVLGLLLLGGVISVFLYGSRSYRQDERLTRMQDELRFGMAQLVADLEMTGFWTQMLGPGNVTVDPNGYPDAGAFGTDCGAPPPGGFTWALHNLEPLGFVNDATAAQTTFPCIAGDEIQEGTDILSIKRIAGAPTTALNSGLTYLRTNGIVGVLFKGAFPPTTVPVPHQDWEYLPRIYFIRRTDESGAPVPTLYRKQLEASGGGTPSFRSEAVAAGIEQLQFEFGVDNSLDGIVDFYVSNPSAAQLARAAAVRVVLLGRSAEIDGTYLNEKTYTVGTLPGAPQIAPKDHFYRRIHSTIVLLRNPTQLRGLAR